VDDERALLTGFLDWYRAVATRKVEGLSLDDASRVMTPSGMSPLGVVKHLGWVERIWFQRTFAGEDPELLRQPGTDNSIEFVLDATDTVESIVEFYGREIAAARRIADAASLNDESSLPSRYFGHVTMRWILLHLIEETARHTGHLDLMREQLDGTIGD
jgi:uncharacterized damage-inducible protein DinB